MRKLISNLSTVGLVYLLIHFATEGCMRLFPQLSTEEALANIIMIILGLISATIGYVIEDPKIKRWGPVVGMCTQPFWFYFTITAGQPGPIMLTIVYTCVWFALTVHQWIILPRRSAKCPL